MHEIQIQYSRKTPQNRQKQRKFETFFSTFPRVKRAWFLRNQIRKLSLTVTTGTICCTWLAIEHHRIILHSTHRALEFSEVIQSSKWAETASIDHRLHIGINFFQKTKPCVCTKIRETFPYGTAFHQNLDSKSEIRDCNCNLLFWSSFLTFN